MATLVRFSLPWSQMEPADQERFINSMLNYWNELSEGQKAYSENLGLLTQQMRGMATAVHALTKLISWVAVLVVFAFFLSMFVFGYVFSSEGDANAIHRRAEALENSKLREEVWDSIKILTSKRCNTSVSGTTNEATEAQER